MTFSSVGDFGDALSGGSSRSDSADRSNNLINLRAGAKRIGCPQCDSIVVAPTAIPYPSLICDRCGSALFPKTPLRLSNISFDSHAYGAGVPLLVAFGTEWCRPFSNMKAALDAAARELEPELRLSILDEGLNGSIFERYMVKAIPTFLIIKEGREVGRCAGSMSSTGLVSWTKEVSVKALSGNPVHQIGRTGDA